MSSNALRRLLRKPFLLDKAALMNWPATEPLPQHERAFREKVWREVIRRVDEALATGLPRLRGEVLVEVALRRAKAMEPFVLAAVGDVRVYHGLRYHNSLHAAGNLSGLHGLAAAVLASVGAHAFVLRGPDAVG